MEDVIGPRMFKELISVTNLLSDGIEFGQTDTCDTPFKAHPEPGAANERDWNLWLKSGELVGHVETPGTNPYPRRADLTSAELNALEKKGWDLETAEQQCEIACRNIVFVRDQFRRALTAEVPRWNELNGIVNTIGTGGGKGMVKRAYRWFSRRLRTLADYQRRLDITMQDNLSDYDVALDGSDDACRADRGWSEMAATEGTRYMTSDLPTAEPIWDDSLTLEEPSEEWGQGDYYIFRKDWQPRLGNPEREGYYLHHLRYHAAIRRGRFEALRDWARLSKRNASRLVEYAPPVKNVVLIGADDEARTAISGDYVSQTVYPKDDSVRRMSIIEEREWAKRYRVMADAWGRGVAPDYRMANCLTFRQVNDLKNEAWSVIRAAPKRTRGFVARRKVLKAAPAVGKTTADIDSLAFWGE